MGRRASVVLLACSTGCAFHSFRIEPRFLDGVWEEDCEAMTTREAEGGTWSVRVSTRPFLFADLHPTSGVWVLDVKEYASHGRGSRASDRELVSVGLRCGDEVSTIPAVACITSETRYFGWASSVEQGGTRIYADATVLAAAGSRGSREDPCKLVVMLRHGTETYEAQASVLLREGLSSWATGVGQE